MRIYAVFLLLASQPAFALELYADAGLGHMWGSNAMLVESPVKSWSTPPPQQSEPGIGLRESGGPHAAVEIGVTFGGVSVFASHASSLSTGRDLGVNFVGAKYRFSVKVP